MIRVTLWHPDLVDLQQAACFIRQEAAEKGWCCRAHSLHATTSWHAAAKVAPIVMPTAPTLTTAIVSLATGVLSHGQRRLGIGGGELDPGRSLLCHLQYGQSNTFGRRLVMRILQEQGE